MKNMSWNEATLRIHGPIKGRWYILKSWVLLRPERRSILARLVHGARKKFES